MKGSRKIYLLSLLDSRCTVGVTKIKKSENLEFHNQDIKTVFEVTRLIYGRDYEKMNTMYKDKPMDTELALVIGSITKSQGIIDQALDLEREGKQMQMCRALQELEQRGMEAGKKVGREAGIELGRMEGIESGKKEILKLKYTL